MRAEPEHDVLERAGLGDVEVDDRVAADELGREEGPAAGEDLRPAQDPPGAHDAPVAADQRVADVLRALLGTRRRVDRGDDHPDALGGTPSADGSAGACRGRAGLAARTYRPRSNGVPGRRLP